MSFVLELQGMDIQPTAADAPQTIGGSWASLILCGSTISVFICFADEN
jgi:hypothetical protein